MNATTLTVAVGGHIVEIATTDSGAAAAIRYGFASNDSVPGPATTQVVIRRETLPWEHWSIHRDGAVVAANLASEHVMFTLNRLLLDLAAGAPTALRATAVRWRDTTVLICGAGLHGTSTVGAWLACHGGALIADGFVEIAPDLTVRPLHLPLQLLPASPLWSRRPPSRPAGHESFYPHEELVPVTSLGGSVWDGPVAPIGAVVIPGHHGDPAEQLGPADALLRICEPDGLGPDRSELFGVLSAMVQRVPAGAVSIDDPDRIVGDVDLALAMANH